MFLLRAQVDEFLTSVTVLSLEFYAFSVLPSSVFSYWFPSVLYEINSILINKIPPCFCFQHASSVFTQPHFDAPDK